MLCRPQNPLVICVFARKMAVLMRCSLKEGNVLFNDVLNTFYLPLYGVIHMVKDHSDSERGNPLPSHGLLYPISILFTVIWRQTYC